MATTITDLRSNTPEKPVWKAVISQMTWTSAGHAAQTATIPVNGVITEIVWTIGDGGVADPDVVFAVQDADGNQLFTTTENDNQTVIDYAGGDFGYNQLCGQGFIISADPSIEPTTNLTVDVTIYGV